MSYQNKTNNPSPTNKRFIFQIADENDGEDILSIIERLSFKGNLALMYTRRPDAFSSLKSEGDDVDIIVCKDTKMDKTIGFGACSVNELFINGEPKKTGYLFGLRGLTEYSRKYPLLHKGYQYLKKVYENKSIPLFITTILEDNFYAQKMLEKKRVFMPNYIKIGAYNVYSIKPKKKRNPKSNLRKATKDDIPAIVRFLNERGKHFQLFPVLKEEDILNGRFRDLSYDDFYILFDEEGKEILATGALWKQNAYKQYIVMHYGGIYKWIRLFSFLFKFMGYPTLPEAGQQLNFSTLSFWAVKDNDIIVFKRFIDNISTYAYEKADILTIGIPDGNPFKEIIETYRRFTYRSLIYSVDWKKNEKSIPIIDDDKPLYLECGLL